MTTGGHVSIVSAAPECHHNLDEGDMWPLEQVTLYTGRRHHAVTPRHSGAAVTS